jgi:hypothetical protein
MMEQLRTNKEAQGFLITFINERRFFIETPDFPGEKPDGSISVDGNKVWEIAMNFQQGGRVTIAASKKCDMLFRTSWIKLHGVAIATTEKIYEDSEIWKVIYQAKTKLVLPTSNAGPLPTMGRQKFGKIK